MVKLVVSEIFGPTIQGEGPSTGQVAFFLRLGGCPLSCVWCDTKYTWDWSQFDSTEELMTLEVSQIADGLKVLGFDYRTPLLVITGGEPMVQQLGITELLNELERIHRFPRRIEIETAGVRPPRVELLEYKNLFFNVSPKLENSGNTFAARYKPDVLKMFIDSDRAIFKFVVNNGDFTEILAMQASCHIPDEKIWIQPEGIADEALSEKLREIAPLAIERGWNISTRLQIYIWGNRRGV